MSSVENKKDTPSPDQENAIHLTGTDMLVSAAAGSGKTFTLVERIVGSIREGRCNIDELLVVTFTNAAASEMRERVEKKLMEAARADKKLLQQIIRLPNASISTLHSFCQSLIRQNFTELDLDPKFRLGGEQEISLIKQSVMEELFEEKYAEGDKEFLSFVRQYGSDRDDSELHEMILSMYDFSRSQPEPEVWLDNLGQSFDIKQGALLKDTRWFEEASSDVERVFESTVDKAAYLARRSLENGCDAYEEALKNDRERAEKLITLLKQGEWDAVGSGMRETFMRFKAIRNGDKAAQDEIKKGRDEYKEAYKKILGKYFFASEQEMLDDLRAVKPLADVLCSLTKAFAAAFQKTKKKKGMLDFNDLEHYALQLLMEKDSNTGRFTGQITETAKELQKKYKEIMVDEYQDTNGVQEAILQCIQNGNNAFVVGDVKQSIYRFRLADPMLFLDKQTSYINKTKDGQALFLKENYRSRPEVLGAINYLFSQFMVKPEMELDYDADAALYAKADYGNPPANSFDGAPAEMFLVDMEDRDDEEGEALGGLELEAHVIAKRLLELKENNTQVFDKDKKQYRSICWRDMAVLMRSVHGKAQTIVEVLRNYGVPAYAAADAGYFEEIEVRLMLSLLSVIDNAQQDIHLAAVLHSPMVEMTAEELAEMRAETPDGDLYRAFCASKNPKAVRFRKKLEGWRRISRRVGVPELLHMLYLESGYYDYVGAQPGGMLRQANLRMLSDRAADYEKTSFRGLFRFLQFIRQMQKRKTDLSSARTLGENEDVVRIMSVHMSKGLEFPVAVIADIGKGFNLTDTSKTILMHRKLGLGPSYTQTEGHVKWRCPTVARHAVAARLIRESKAEEMRILYVALTRAREKLILTGNVAKLSKKVFKWIRALQYQKAAFPGYNVLEANSWIDWIAPAVMRDKECGKPLRDIADCVEEASGFPYDFSALGNFKMDVKICPAAAEAEDESDEAEKEWVNNIREKLPLPETDAGKEKKAVLDWVYPFATDTPSKFTVTEIKDRVHALRMNEFEEKIPELAAAVPQQNEEPEFPVPEFMKSPSEDTADTYKGASYGTLMHRVLERLSNLSASGRDEIEKAVDALAASGVLTEEERAAINISSIEAFFKSSLGQRVSKAKAVYREQPFSMLVDASRFGYEQHGENEDRIFVQGVIDLLFEEDDGKIVLVDYKTDRHTTPDIMRERYRVQMSFYREAIEQSTNKQVKECYIYRLSDNDAVKVEIDKPVYLNSL